MDFTYYTRIILVVCLVPASLVFLTGCIFWRVYRKSEIVMVIIMKGIISEKNIDRRPTYLVCNRKLPPNSRFHFMISSIFLISMCVLSFFTLAIIDVTYNCTDDPNIDCFKKKDEKWTVTPYHEIPVNCSSISKDDFLLCYRITVLDPERAFIGAGVAYLLFKMLNFALFLVSNIMLWFAQKWERNTLIYVKVGIVLVMIIVALAPFIVGTYLVEVESAFRKLSFVVLLQVGLIEIIVIYFITFVPWEKFSKNDEYYGDASLPNNDGDSEMAYRNDIVH